MDNGLFKRWVCVVLFAGKYDKWDKSCGLSEPLASSSGLASLCLSFGFVGTNFGFSDFSNLHHLKISKYYLQFRVYLHPNSSEHLFFPNIIFVKFVRIIWNHLSQWCLMTNTETSAHQQRLSTDRQDTTKDKNLRRKGKRKFKGPNMGKDYFLFKF